MKVFFYLCIQLFIVFLLGGRSWKYLYCLLRKTPPLIGIPDGKGKQVLEVLILFIKENAAINRDARQEGKAGLGGTYITYLGKRRHKPGNQAGG
jgi:hypothetical protein